MPVAETRPKVLLVDDEPSVLAGLRRSLHGRFDVTCAESGSEALALAAAAADAAPFAVVVSDMRMPKMDGAELLHRLREEQPDTVRVLLTGYADVDSAVAAVNLGQVFGFLAKPCDTALLVATLDDAVAQHRLVTAERELLERTLRGSVGALLDTLALANPAAFARAVRIKDVVVEILDGLTDAERWPVVRWEVEVAAMLSQLGAVTLPDPTLEKLHRGLALTADEADMVARLPAIADSLLGGIPRLERVRRMIIEQQAPVGAASPGGGILRVAVDYEALLTSGAQPAVALGTIRQRHGAAAADLLAPLLPDDGAGRAVDVVEIGIEALSPGMTLESDVRTAQGALVVGRGLVFNDSLAERLRNFADNNAVTGTVTVRVRRPHGTGTPGEAPGPAT